MTDTDIIEAAAQVLARYPSWEWESMNADAHQSSIDLHRDTAAAVLVAVTPMIRAAALEEAAKVAEDAEAQEYEAHTRLKAEGKEEEALIYARYAIMAKTIAAAIRALKEHPAESSAA
jgi:hypothetical protein